MKLLRTQRRICAALMKCATRRVVFDTERLDEIGEAITKEDIKELIKEKAIKRKPVTSISRSRSKKTSAQKAKGRRKGPGSRKGKAGARVNPKRTWINTVRAQRQHLRLLKSKGTLDQKTYRELYRKSKGGFFRSRRHITIYLAERGKKK